MKIISINNTGNASFHGLWGKPRELVTGADTYTVYKDMEWKYHPFADETEKSVQYELDSKRYEISVPSYNDFETESITSKPKAGKKLSFTQKEFSEYKKFYGKNLPESMQNIEKELVAKDLSHHLNNKLISAVKRFLHRIKLI